MEFIMKTIRLIGLVFLTLFLSGCYTQLAVEERQQKSYDSYETYGDEYVSADTVYYDESSTSDDKVVNNYYILPGYRRYLWHYYPSVSIGIGPGYYFDWWMWDTYYPRWWYCDPWYPPVAYYPFWYYQPNYYHYGWDYDNYYQPSNYKYRDNNLARVRGNDGGGRGSYIRRDAIKAYDRSRDAVRSRVGVSADENGSGGRTRINANETPRPGRTTEVNRGTVNERESRTAVPDRRKETNPEVTPGTSREPRVREKAPEGNSSGERKTIYVPRQRKNENEQPKPDVRRVPEKRSTPSNEGSSGRRSSPPSYNPPSNSGSSRSTPPSRSSGGNSGGSSGGSRSRSSDTPRRTR